MGFNRDGSKFELYASEIEQVLSKGRTVEAPSLAKAIGQPDTSFKLGPTFLRGDGFKLLQIGRANILEEVLGEAYSFLATEAKNRIEKRQKKDGVDLATLRANLSKGSLEKLAEISAFEPLEPEDKLKTFCKRFVDLSVSNFDADFSRLFENLFGMRYAEGMNSELVEDFAKSNQAAITSRNSRPRWAEEKRPSIQFPLKISEQLLLRIDEAANDAGINRTEWFIERLRTFLSQHRRNTVLPPPPEYPDYKAKKSIHFRLPPEMDREFREVSEKLGLKRSYLAKCIAHAALRDDQRLGPSQDL